MGIAVDSDHRIYVTDGSIAYDPQRVHQHIQVFDSAGNFLAGFGETGVGAGQFQESRYTAVDDNGVVYTTDSSLNRVVVHAPGVLAQNTRAIIVAGGGPYPGNVLWSATQANANFSFRALAAQGLGKGAIQYLSADLDLDLDQNGLADEVDANASNANLQLSILGPSMDGSDGFAGDASIDHLVLYLIDHGGLNAFRMSGAELLNDTELAGWIDTWKLAHPSARLTLIYDACQSGSFAPKLTGPLRTVITSAQSNQSAYFVSQGTLSFSNFFWTQIFNGDSVKSAFDTAAAATSTTFPMQTPLMDTDLIDDGSSNSTADLAAADLLLIGAGTDQFGQGPELAAFTVTPVGRQGGCPQWQQRHPERNWRG